MTGLRRQLTSSTLWTSGGFAVLMLAGILVNAVLARALSPAELGVYFLAFSLVASAAAVGRLGLNQAVVRLVAGTRGTPDSPAGGPAVAVVLRLAGQAAVLAGAILAVGVVPWAARTVFDSPRLADLALLLGCWCAVEAFRLVASEALRGFGDIRGATVLGDPGRQVLFLAAVVLAVLLDEQLPLSSVVVAAIVAGALVLLIALLLLLRAARRAPGHRTAVDSAVVLRMSLPMMVTAVALLAVTQGDVWLAGAFLPEEEVALYAATVRLVFLVIFPLRIANAVLSPVIARMHADGNVAQLERVLRLTATATALPTLLIVGVVTLGGGHVLGMVYGDFYRQGATMLAILACGQVVNALAGGCGQVLLMTGHHKAMMVVTALSGAAFLLVGTAATWAFGAVGLAVAAASTTALSNVTLVLVVRRRLGIWTVPTLGRRVKVGG